MEYILAHWQWFVFGVAAVTLLLCTSG